MSRGSEDPWKTSALAAITLVAEAVSPGFPAHLCFLTSVGVTEGGCSLVCHSHQKFHGGLTWFITYLSVLHVLCKQLLSGL